MPAALSALLLGLDIAAGAEVTDLPELMSVEAALSYRWIVERGGLESGDAPVGSRRYTRHDVGISAAFAPLSWAAFGVRIVTTPSQRWSYGDALPVVYDPAVERPVVQLDGTPSSTDRRSAGVQGVWIEAMFAPPPSVARGARSSWRLDLALRAPAGTRSMWSANASGVRGAAPGGAALRLAAAFRRPVGRVTPFFRAEAVKELPALVSVIDEDQTDWGLQRLEAPSAVSAMTGVSLALDPDAPLEVVLDGWVGADYRTPGTVASGLLLPHVLDTTRTFPVVVDEQVGGSLGLGVAVATSTLGEARLGLSARWGTPFRLENVYQIDTTPSTWSLAGSLTVSAALGIKRVVE